jgi:hypothetical protein
MPWFPNPAGGAPIQAPTNPNPAGGSLGYYSDPGYNGPPPGGSPSSPSSPSPSTPTGATPTVNTGNSQQLASGINSLLGAIASGNKQAFDEAVRQFNESFGLDKDKFDESVRQFNQNYLISQSGVTGTYQGAPTMQAQAQNAGLYGFVPTLNAQGVPVGPNGQPLQTLAAQNQAYSQQLGLISQAAALQANPFRQQQAIGQMGSLLGGQGVAAFQAPNTVAGVGTAGGNTSGGMGYLQQMIDDIRDPTANQSTMSNVLNAIPTPNKLNSNEFLRASPSTQSMVLQGMQEKYGLDPNDALSQIKATLPQFTAPTTMGTVKR